MDIQTALDILRNYIYGFDESIEEVKIAYEVLENYIKYS